MGRKYLLIVEDEEELRQQLATELEDLTQMIVVQASDGVQAYQKTRNQKFDVILSDFKLPKISGKQLIDALRETSHNMYTPILIYTAVVEEAKVQTREQKFIDFFEKPQGYQEIADKLIELTKLDPNKKNLSLMSTLSIHLSIHL